MLFFLCEQRLEWDRNAVKLAHVSQINVNLCFHQKIERAQLSPRGTVVQYPPET